MYPDFSGLAYLAVAAMGAMAGMLLSVFIWLISFFVQTPDWLFIAPPIIGSFGAMIFFAATDR